MPMAAETAISDRQWWAQRWIDVLEAFGWRRRLERARNYLREGRVLALDFVENRVVAAVQGTAAEPYNVSLYLDPFTDEEWGYVVQALSQRAIFAAKLLAGEMPTNIEEVFTASGLSLFPFNKFDIHSHCSCPDPANPCKHIGAVYYLLGSYFGDDPFILFQLRGRSRGQILAALRQLRASPAMPPQASALAAPSLAIDCHFASYPDALDPSLVVITPPPSNETVLEWLGPIPADAPDQERMLWQFLKLLYAQVAHQAMEADN